MNKYVIKIIFLLLLLTGMTAGCWSGSTPSMDENGRMETVATIFPIADMAAHIGGERVMVTCLLPAGASPHTFEPTTDQVRKSFGSDLFLYMGGGLDDWAVKIAATGSDHQVLLSLVGAAQERGWSPLPDPLATSQRNEPCNPHLWLDPLTARDYLCPALAEAMVKTDPQNDAFYRANLRAYQQELTALDKEISASLDSLSNKSFVAVHSAWEYFAARYGLVQVAVITDFPGQEPSAAWISGLVDLCRRHDVRVVAAEPQLSPAAAEMIAREIGGSVIILDPLGGADIPQRKSFLELMRYNTAVLKDAFSEQ
ncbi:MAG: zinc ABC transporter substrate-binding protein [Firmicutes bacterium]|nr:zinc ABC transporter substrate-binding protein [Bacillota bacterium]